MRRLGRICERFKKSVRFVQRIYRSLDNFEDLLSDGQISATFWVSALLRLLAHNLTIFVSSYSRIVNNRLLWAFRKLEIHLLDTRLLCGLLPDTLIRKWQSKIFILLPHLFDLNFLQLLVLSNYFVWWSESSRKALFLDESCQNLWLLSLVIKNGLNHFLSDSFFFLNIVVVAVWYHLGITVLKLGNLFLLKLSLSCCHKQEILLADIVLGRLFFNVVRHFFQT